MDKRSNKVMIIAASAIVVLLALVFAGIKLFNGSGSSSSAPKGGSGMVKKGQDQPDDFRSNRINRPDFGQPKREADVRGVVKSVLGDQVTILVMDKDKGFRNSSSTPSNPSSSGEKKEAASLTAQVGGGRMMGGMGARGGQGGFGEGTQDREKMMEELKSLSTGEETVEIPVGIRMLKSSTDENGKREMVEANLQDIAADKMITVWLSQGEGPADGSASSTASSTPKTAEFVMVN